MIVKQLGLRAWLVVAFSSEGWHFQQWLTKVSLLHTGLEVRRLDWPDGLTRHKPAP